MPSHYNTKTFPFTEWHLRKLRAEIDEAGGYVNLMQKKKALSQKMGMKYIVLSYDTENYKQNYLTGVYESLRPFYDTDMPYVFWNLMYEMLLKMEVKNV